MVLYIKTTTLQKWILCLSLGGEEDINRIHFKNVFFFYIMIFWVCDYRQGMDWMN
jgi:hypothetical protein